MHLHGLKLDLRKKHSQMQPSAFGYTLDGEDSDEAGHEDFNYPQGFEQVPTKVKQENGMSNLNTQGPGHQQYFIEPASMYIISTQFAQ